MFSAKNLISFVAAVSLLAGAAGIVGCQSEASSTPNSTSGDTMSGTGGGNGNYGSNPAQAMHGNPADTQPGQ